MEETLQTSTQPDLRKIQLQIDGADVLPTREEFYTNYPFYKYWGSQHNQQLLTPAGISIYIHIPFCIQICDYCFYMKDLIKSKDQVNEYVDYLCKEIQLVSETFGLQRREVHSIYIGGGTPSVLTEAQFKRIVDTIHKYHKFGTPEFSFEAEPGTFSKAKLQSYKDSGVNRISMGVQSFNDEVIKLSSRKHNGAQAINSIRMVTEMGGFQLNIDLLSGLAGDKMNTWEESVHTALAQGVDMLTIYKMKTYANTNFFLKGVHNNEITLPDNEEEIGFMQRALEIIDSAGYQRWSNFAFTREGCINVYAENTWRGQDLIAYGASSFGKIGNINYQNINNTALYFDKLKQDQLPVFRTYNTTSKDAIIRELLLCAARLSSYRKAEFMQKFGFDYFQLIPDTIHQLEQKGYITGNREELELTRQGVLFGDFVGKVLASAVKDVLGKDKIGFTY
ncbi:radical SAM family heme chaperone HemW [Chitinophaga rhizophila]|uniref:Heme chaperone HemW n=1 Tax=Chitinophaga rhizophila TaxID=2866212 RepID=A0ABS7G5Z7_9BACT|nr:radical SAM family heme chaperone HemW [Chitinophaga rhizophila]MBW8683059.1 radical SAM family heme chaperone HemW [Chitinophaga rhizophila]